MTAQSANQITKESIEETNAKDRQLMDIRKKLIFEKIVKNARMRNFYVDEIELRPAKEMIEYFESLGYTVRKSWPEGYYTIHWS